MLLYTIKRLLSVLIVAVFVPAQYRAESISAASDFPGYAIDKSTNPHDKWKLRVSDEATEAVDDERGIPPVIRESLASSSSGKMDFGGAVLALGANTIEDANILKKRRVTRLQREEAVRLKSARDANRFTTNQALEPLLKESGITADKVEDIVSSLVESDSTRYRLIDKYDLELMVLGHEFFTQVEKSYRDWRSETLTKRNEKPIKDIHQLRALVGKDVSFDSFRAWQYYLKVVHVKVEEIYLKIAWFYFLGYDGKLENEELYYMATGFEYFRDTKHPTRIDELSAAKKKASSEQPVPTSRNEKVPDPVQQKHAGKASSEQPVPTPRIEIPEIDLNIDAFVDHPEFKAKLDEFAEETGWDDQVVRKALHYRIGNLLTEEANRRSEQPVPTPRNEMVPEIDPIIDAFVDNPKFKAKLDELAKETGLDDEVVRKALHYRIGNLLTEAANRRSE
ncbi:hypothetical protein PsorP6_001664 [Peronosclerospora sorghi]|uniref:Uncharacterized protein n=1 Tax=Peronosclerospora sorghi TaxID=230839 RepID=A0ACC0WSQ6_9STRA|nr:hypothetical protein PsorP6_001664 [Peronosclerospora sorghi]